MPGSGAHVPFPRSLVDRCGEREKTPLGSTLQDEEIKDFSEKSLFSQDALQNPAFHDWHVVLLRYCDGAAFASASGDAMFTAMLHDLLVNGLSEASDVVVSGCSAGAVAAALHVDKVQHALPNVFVTALLDSGVFPDFSRHDPDAELVLTKPSAAGIWHADGELVRLFKERGLQAAGSIPSACLAAYESTPWRCFFLEYLLPFIEAPAFVLQSRFDSSNVRDVERLEDLEAFGNGVAWRLTRAIESDTTYSDKLIGRRRSPHGLFLDECFHHCMTWGQLKASGASQPEAFISWRNGPARRSWLAARRAGGAREQPEEREWHERRLWRHTAACDGAGDSAVSFNDSGGPCLRRECCPLVAEDLAFWRKSFSNDASAQ